MRNPKSKNKPNSQKKIYLIWAYQKPAGVWKGELEKGDDMVQTSRCKINNKY